MELSSTSFITLIIFLSPETMTVGKHIASISYSWVVLRFWVSVFFQVPSILCSPMLFQLWIMEVLSLSLSPLQLMCPSAPAGLAVTKVPPLPHKTCLYWVLLCVSHQLFSLSVSKHLLWCLCSMLKIFHFLISSCACKLGFFLFFVLLRMLSFSSYNWF